MVSLAVLLGLFVAQFVALTIASVWMARLLRAPNASWRRGAAVIAIVTAIQMLSAVTVLIPGRLLAIVIVASSFFLAVQIVVAVVAVRRVLGLSFGRSWAVVGAMMVVVIAYTVGSLVLVRPYVIESFVVPTASMSPTVQAGDAIVACKLLTPRRWDCVVYWSPGEPGQRFVKRLIGLPGERLRFEGGSLYINDAAVTPPPMLAGKLNAGKPREMALYRDGETITLGLDQVFFIGENADVSYDSRHEGPAPQGGVIGVADLRYWPIGRIGLIR